MSCNLYGISSFYYYYHVCVPVTVPSMLGLCEEFVFDGLFCPHVVKQCNCTQVYMKDTTTQ